MGKITASRQITEGVIWKQILIFFFPILLGTFFQQMYNTVDTIIVGRFVSTRALAAVGTTGPLVNMFSGFFTGLSSGATVILAQFYGANDPKGVDRTLHTGFSLSLILGLLVTAVGCGLGPTILTWMQTPEECLEMAGTYLRIYFAGSLASMVYNMEAGILRAMGDSRTPVYSLAAACIVAALLSGKAAAWLYDGYLAERLQTAVSDTLRQKLQTFAELLDRIDPTDTITGAAGDALRTVMVALLTMVAFLVIFLVAMVIVRALAKLTRNVNRVPVVGGVNRVLGGVLGAAEAFLLCYLIGMAAAVLITFSENEWSWLNTAVVQKSTILNWFVQFEFPV